jgi:hypothetical protein
MIQIVPFESTWMMGLLLRLPAPISMLVHSPLTAEAYSGDSAEVFVGDNQMGVMEVVDTTKKKQEQATKK